MLTGLRVHGRHFDILRSYWQGARKRKASLAACLRGQDNRYMCFLFFHFCWSGDDKISEEDVEIHPTLERRGKGWLK